MWQIRLFRNIPSLLEAILGEKKVVTNDHNREEVETDEKRIPDIAPGPAGNPAVAGISATGCLTAAAGNPRNLAREDGSRPPQRESGRQSRLPARRLHRRT